MAGQDLSNATIRVVTAQVAVTQYQALVYGTLEDTVVLASASNVSGFYGFALNNASSGQTVGVHVAGGMAKALAGGSVSLGSYLVLNGTDGCVKNISLTNSNSFVVGRCERAGVAADVVPVTIMPFIQNGA